MDGFAVDFEDLAAVYGSGGSVRRIGIQFRAVGSVGLSRFQGDGLSLRGPIYGKLDGGAA